MQQVKFFQVNLLRILSEDLRLNHRITARAGCLGGLECRPIHQKAVGLIPSQDTCLGCGFDTWSGRV